MTATCARTWRGITARSIHLRRVFRRSPCRWASLATARCPRKSLTAGPDECRAWTIPDGATALDAAGTIHSDLARGFIRAEVVDWKDMVACGSTAEARRRGLLRSEGKAYRVNDGDVIEVLFNVGR